MNTITQRLKEAYERKGLSYIELSKISKVPRATIQRYVAGTTDRIDIDKLQAICNALEIDTAYVIGWSSPKEPKREPEQDAEIIQLLSSLSDESRKQAIDYLRYLATRGDKK